MLDHLVNETVSSFAISYHRDVISVKKEAVEEFKGRFCFLTILIKILSIAYIACSVTLMLLVFFSFFYPSKMYFPLLLECHVIIGHLTITFLNGFVSGVKRTCKSIQSDVFLCNSMGSL